MNHLDPRRFYEEVLRDNGIITAFGVPDSCLKGLLGYFYAIKLVSEHVVVANEGAVVSLAAGHYLSTNKVALAYMQNSGFANALNPLQSLAAKEVFGIPMLLMIGWRGKPGEHDEPEHALAGPSMLDNLRANGLPYEIVPDTIPAARAAVTRLVTKAQQENTPVALAIPNHTFSEYYEGVPQPYPPAKATSHTTAQNWMSSASHPPMSRELAIRHLPGGIQHPDVSISSVGGNSREFDMIRKERGESLGRNFFSIGAMGHTFAIAYGVATGFSSGRVFCIDGDGLFLMHAGNNVVLAGLAPPNLIYVVTWNGIHCSTGSQSLPISKEHFLAMAEGLPYRPKYFVNTAEGLKKAFHYASSSTLVIVVVNDSVSKFLPRPSESAYELRDMFMKSFL